MTFYVGIFQGFFYLLTFSEHISQKTSLGDYFGHIFYILSSKAATKVSPGEHLFLKYLSKSLEYTVNDNILPNFYFCVNRRIA